MKLFLVMVYFAVSLYSAQFIKQDEVIVDSINALMWQENKENITVKVTHEGALRYCESLRLNGYDNWRVPKIEEFKHIIDKNSSKSVKVVEPFKFVLPDNYWAEDRTWLRNFGLYGYYIFFQSGTAYYQNRTYLKYVKCVRDIK